MVANWCNPNTVWVNNGIGTFTDSGQGLGYRCSVSVALGDLNGDGDLDAMVANYGPSGTVWINERDSDGDGSPDILDECPFDSNKIEPGVCGCGVADTDADSDGTPDCMDEPCPADIDGNGDVNGADLSLVLGAWGTSDAAADVDGSGTVDGADLALVLGSWGACPE